jgi:outer membrane protein assembly factor BamB
MPMRSLRRASLVLLGVTLLASTAWLPEVSGQIKVQVKQAAPPPGAPVPLPVMVPPPPAPPPTNAANPDGFEYGGISLPKDEQHLNKKIEAAVDYIREEDWKEAIPLLQKLLEIKEDVFARLMRKSPDGKEVPNWISVKTEADRLIANLPPNGRDFYKLTYGNEAARLLKKYKESGDAAILAEIMKRYAHTDAGGEAIRLLASYHLDRGNYSVAIRCYEKLFNREGADKLPPAVLFKAAFAAHMAPVSETKGSNPIVASKISEKDLWRQLKGQTREVSLGDQTMPVDDLEEYVAKLQRPTLYVNSTDSPVFRATPNRGNQLSGGPAFFVPKWRRSTVAAHSESYRPDSSSAPAKVEDSLAYQHLRKAEKWAQNHNQPLLTSFAPIAVTVSRGEEKEPLLIYKDYWGINAFNMRTRERSWDTPSSWSLERMLGKHADARKQQALTGWLDFYVGSQNQRPQILFENSAVSTLSTDGKYVYVVEDLAVPPPSHSVNPHMGGGMGNPQPTGYSPEIVEAIRHNKLLAFSLQTNGKLTWEVGEKGELGDCCFLGPPLPLGGKLYVLTEKQQELRLVCLDPDALGAIVSSQILGTTHEKIENDTLRRTQAAHLSYGEGILVCPTNAGAVFGINLLENSLVWAYPYREKGEAPVEAVGGPIMMRGPGVIVRPNAPAVANSTAHQQSQWKVSAPVIQDGKVVFTAPDARSIHCINLRDGSPVWVKKKLDDDLYLGNVYNSKVLIVGKKSVRALSLGNGDTLWTVETGLPSGQGIGSDNLYFLPLKEAGRAREPEICAIDMETGQTFHTKSRAKTAGSNDLDVPGNLLFFEGDVISQTPWEIVAYPQLKVKIAQMDERIAMNPNDPIGLTERGDLRLDKGDLAGAIEDLSTALKNGPDQETRARARAKLYDTLTAYIQKNFTGAEKYLQEYEELCNVDMTGTKDEAELAERQAEQRRRRATFLWLVAKGREEQGRLVEAFEKYQEFGAVAGKQQELVPAVDDRHVKAAPDVWSRGRIMAMMAKARPEHREPLEKLIRSRWEKVRGTNDLDELRGFVRLFGPVCDAGKEARLELVERLIEQKDNAGADKSPLLEAEMELNHFRNGHESPELAARATEALARLYTRRGLLEDAAYCYRKLGTTYANIKVRDGKTGRDIYNDTATDKRLLPHLDEPDRTGAFGKLQGKVERGGEPISTQVFHFEHNGEPLPFFHRHTVGLRLDNHQLRLTDRLTGEDRWQHELTRTQFSALANANGQGNTLHFPYRTLGHLVVLPVGHMVFGIDPVNQKVLWEKNLATLGNSSGLNAPAAAAPVPTQFFMDPHDNSLQVLYQDGWIQRLGQTGPLEGPAFCIQTRETLSAIDPLDGRTLWSRMDVNPHNFLFADDEYVFVVELDSNDNNNPAVTGTRAFRLSDGISVKVPDFAAAYQKRRQLVGRHILTAENDPKTATVTLRLYDVLTGQDLWKAAYPARSILLQSDDPAFTGAVEPNGTVHVVDLRSLKEVLTSKLADPAADLLNVQAVHLLADKANFYLALNTPVDPNVIRVGVLQSNLLPNIGMRAVPVNGMLYAFERASGEIAWFVPAKHQMIGLDQFRDLPIVLLTSRHQKWENAFGRMQMSQVVAALAIDKTTGKVTLKEDNIPGATPFHALRVNPRARTIELIGNNVKLIHSPDPKAIRTEKEKIPATRNEAPTGKSGAAVRNRVDLPVEAPDLSPGR